VVAVGNVCGVVDGPALQFNPGMGPNLAAIVAHPKAHLSFQTTPP
jgi:hypothetical protein